LIDEEAKAIVAEQYEREKQILRANADGHNQLSELLIEREVIFAEDLEKIFGKRQWVSRQDELIAQNGGNDILDEVDVPAIETPKQNDNSEKSESTVEN
jgi:cell division protease FtsH